MRPLDFLSIGDEFGKFSKDFGKFSEESDSSINYKLERKLFYHSIWFEYVLEKLKNLVEEFISQSITFDAIVNLYFTIDEQELKNIKEFARKMIESEEEYTKWASRLYTAFQNAKKELDRQINLSFELFIEELIDGIVNFIEEEKHNMLRLDFERIRKEVSLFISRVGIFSSKTKYFYENFLCSRFDKIFIKLLNILTRVGKFAIVNEGAGKYKSTIIYHSPLLTSNKLYEIKSKYSVNEFDAQKFFEVVFDWKDLIKRDRDGDIIPEQSFDVLVSKCINKINIVDIVQDGISKDEIVLSVDVEEKIKDVFVSHIVEKDKYGYDVEGIKVFKAYLKDRENFALIASEELKKVINAGDLTMYGKKGTLILIVTKEGYIYLDQQNLVNFIKYYAQKNLIPLKVVDENTLISNFFKSLKGFIKDYKSAKLYVRTFSKGKIKYETSRICYKVEFDEQVLPVIEENIKNALEE